MTALSNFPLFSLEQTDQNGHIVTPGVCPRHPVTMAPIPIDAAGLASRTVMTS
jgi:hypothetical protein